MSKNLSIRGARLEFSGRFKSSILDYTTVADLLKRLRAANTSKLATLPAEIIFHVLTFVLGGKKTTRDLVAICWEPLRPPPPDDRFRIGVRKRPLWPSETAQGAFDLLTVDAKEKRCVLHDARLDRSMKTFTYHREFGMDAFFESGASNREVFEETCLPLLERALAGERATFLAFGQTGTGKTYTVHELEREVATELFKANGRLPRSWQVELTVFELRGKEARDLLDGGKPVRLLQSGDGIVEVVGARAVVAGTEAEMIEAFDAAHLLRSTKATASNAQSSRSHAIVRLTFAEGSGGGGGAAEEGGGGGSGGSISGGVMTMVDLAGSERNEDSLKNRGKLSRESAAINASLMTVRPEVSTAGSSATCLGQTWLLTMPPPCVAYSQLKDCFRAIMGQDVEQEVVIEVRTLEGALVSERLVASGQGSHGGGGAGGIMGAGDEERAGGADGRTGVIERVVVRDKAGGAVKDLRMPFRYASLASPAAILSQHAPAAF